MMPPGWNHESRLVADIGELLVAAQADHSWVQVMTEVGFVVAALLCGIDDRTVRLAMATTLSKGLMEAADSGQHLGAFSPAPATEEVRSMARTPPHPNSHDRSWKKDSSTGRMKPDLPRQPTARPKGLPRIAGTKPPTPRGGRT